MVFTQGTPPEKEHPLTTIGVCALLMGAGFLNTNGGWAVVKFGLSIRRWTHERDTRWPSYLDGAEYILVGAAIMALGVGVFVATIWWIGMAVKSVRQGNQAG